MKSKTINHGYDEASWWYKEFISKEEWFEKTQWLKLKPNTKEYNDKLKECYRDLLKAYWSLDRLTEFGSYQNRRIQSEMTLLWNEYNHVNQRIKSYEDFPNMCCTSFEAQTIKEPFVL